MSVFDKETKELRRISREKEIKKELRKLKYEKKAKNQNLEQTQPSGKTGVSI